MHPPPRDPRTPLTYRDAGLDLEEAQTRQYLAKAAESLEDRGSGAEIAVGVAGGNRHFTLDAED